MREKAEANARSRTYWLLFLRIFVHHIRRRCHRKCYLILNSWILSTFLFLINFKSTLALCWTYVTSYRLFEENMRTWATCNRQRSQYDGEKLKRKVECNKNNLCVNEMVKWNANCWIGRGRKLLCNNVAIQPMMMMADMMIPIRIVKRGKNAICFRTHIYITSQLAPRCAVLCSFVIYIFGGQLFGRGMLLFHAALSYSIDVSANTMKMRQWWRTKTETPTRIAITKTKKNIK